MKTPILIISYYWPPCGGAGVQRWLKFAKYLPEFGWEPVILTVDPAFASFPAIDHSLEADIPDGIRVEKTRAVNYFSYGKKRKESTGMPAAGFASGDKGSFLNKIARFTRGNFFIPDPRRGWNRYAFKRACELIEELDIRHVVTTSPPHSTQLIGMKLKKRFQAVKWIADLRDPWTDIYYYKMFYHTFLARRIDSRYEKRTIDQADIILTVGESLSGLLKTKTKGSAGKISVIPNGFDEDDFLEVHQSLNGDTKYIVYAGTISSQYPVSGFLRSVKSVLESKKNNVVARFIGIFDDSSRHTITTILGESNVEFIPYINHRDSIQYISNSSLLLLIIPDHHENKLIITGKLFEYLRTGKPIICLGPPDGDAAKIIEETGAGKTFWYNDEQGISNYIMEEINNNTPYEIPARFSRRNVAEHLSGLLERMK